MLWMCTKDATKHNKRYMSTTVKIPSPKVSIQHSIDRLDKLNDMFSYYPSLKSIKASPASLPSMDKQFSKLKMCTRVLSALPASIVLVYYYAYKGQHFPVDLKRLKKDLMLVKTQERCQSQLIHQLKNIASGKREESGLTDTTK